MLEIHQRSAATASSHRVHPIVALGVMCEGGFNTCLSSHTFRFGHARQNWTYQIAEESG
jgi:hypothetical protein